MWDTTKHATFQDWLTSQTTDELVSHLTHLHAHFDRCEESGQGISTKEVVWESGISKALRERRLAELRAR
jgi:hypothetical protein